MNDVFNISKIKEEITYFETKISKNENLDDREKESLYNKKKEIDSTIIFNNKEINRLKSSYYRFIYHKTYDEEIQKLEAETKELESLNSRIENLLSDSNSVPGPGGNKKHKKNIEKMYKIGKRYKLLSKNSYHISGTPYAETRVFDGMDDGHYVFYMPSNPKIRYKYKPGLWIIKPCSSIKTKKDKCRKFRRTKRRT